MSWLVLVSSLVLIITSFITWGLCLVGVRLEQVGKVNPISGGGGQLVPDMWGWMLKIMWMPMEGFGGLFGVCDSFGWFFRGSGAQLMKKTTQP